MAHVLRHPSGT